MVVWTRGNICLTLQLQVARQLNPNLSERKINEHYYDFKWTEPLPLYALPASFPLPTSQTPNFTPMPEHLFSTLHSFVLASFPPQPQDSPQMCIAPLFGFPATRPTRHPGGAKVNVYSGDSEAIKFIFASCTPC